VGSFLSTPQHSRSARPQPGLVWLAESDDGTPGIASHVARLQFNIANPSAGAMKVYDIDDEKKLVHVYGLRMGQELEGEKLGEEFSGYIFRCVVAGRTQRSPTRPTRWTQQYSPTAPPCLHPAIAA